MPKSSEDWKRNPEVVDGWVKDYELAPGYTLTGWVTQYRDTFTAMVYHKGDYRGVYLGSRPNFTELEAARRWCDLMLKSWWDVAQLTEKTIKSLWYVERN